MSPRNDTGSFVLPQVYLIGYTAVDMDGLKRYLTDSGNEDFLHDIDQALLEGLSPGEVLCSFYAKLCYASLTSGKNDNVTRLRAIRDNLVACFEQGHGSVFEHCSLNFVARDVSRILTHELVRHRAGANYSQTSGRFVRLRNLDVVTDPILASSGVLSDDEQEAMRRFLEEYARRCGSRIDSLNLSFNDKKKVTSAVRRFLPNGQANEIGFTLNIRSLRHTVQMRTSRFAEREIRLVFEQVYRISRDRFPLMYYGAVEERVDDIVEVTDMRMQPYDRREA